ncbi:MAG: hypothetical protein KGQ49_00185 [Verrucomicrobia bacterium]|nr:hypothetical protein [Verrucomicrobiota bacterium]MBU6445797.1 hypothetical protein [Verrucomicrobiota bacterium]MDE3047429.1 hypothetical protein [Verrucomicrobiota bacterium]
MNLCTAIIPYTQPIAAEEFVRREMEKARATTVISEQLVSRVQQPPLPKSFNRELDARVVSAAELDGDKIAEALQSELVITTANNAKPIVATYGCGSCVAVGGWDPTNKIAFVVQFANTSEVIESGGLIFAGILELAKKPIRSPIQLHLRGGLKGQSEDIVAAITLWMRMREDLPMKIVSDNILTSSMDKCGQSLLIDSRSGQVSKYSPMEDAKCRRDLVSECGIVRETMKRTFPSAVPCGPPTSPCGSRFEPHAAKLGGDKIAEALQSELVITTAEDAKPIVGTYGCFAGVAVGGWDPTNKIAFVAHFINPSEVKRSGGLIFGGILELAKKPIRSPIQLHLRGGYQGESEDIVEAIKLWMRRREKLPMEIASEDILTSHAAMRGKNLFIDSRSGQVSSEMANTNHRRRDVLSECGGLMGAMSKAMESGLNPNLTLAYFPT